MKRQALLGSGVVAIGVASIALLAPQAASALDFSFTFDAIDVTQGAPTPTTVSGIIRGLVEGVNSGPSTIEITAGPAGITGTYEWSSIYGGGFYVDSGAIADFKWIGKLGQTVGVDMQLNGYDPVPFWRTGVGTINAITFFTCDPESYVLYFEYPYSQGGYTKSPDQCYSGGRNLAVADIATSSFAPVAEPPTPPPSSESVPGPLPLFGAAAAFGYSRKLRKRIKGSTPVA